MIIRIRLVPAVSMDRPLVWKKLGGRNASLPKNNLGQEKESLAYKQDIRVERTNQEWLWDLDAKIYHVIIPEFYNKKMNFSKEKKRQEIYDNLYQCTTVIL